MRANLEVNCNNAVFCSKCAIVPWFLPKKSPKHKNSANSLFGTLFILWGSTHALKKNLARFFLLGLFCEWNRRCKVRIEQKSGLLQFTSRWWLFSGGLYGMEFSTQFNLIDSKLSMKNWYNTFFTLPKTDYEIETKKSFVLFINNNRLLCWKQCLTVMYCLKTKGYWIESHLQGKAIRR